MRTKKLRQKTRMGVLKACCDLKDEIIDGLQTRVIKWEKVYHKDMGEAVKTIAKLTKDLREANDLAQKGMK